MYRGVLWFCRLEWNLMLILGIVVFLIIYSYSLIIRHDLSSFHDSPADSTFVRAPTRVVSKSRFSREHHGLPLSIPKLDVWLLC